MNTLLNILNKNHINYDIRKGHNSSLIMIFLKVKDFDQVQKELHKKRIKLDYEYRANYNYACYKF